MWLASRRNDLSYSRCVASPVAVSLSLLVACARNRIRRGTRRAVLSSSFSLSLSPCCRELGCSGEHGVAEWRRSGLGGARASTARHWYFRFLRSCNARATGAVAIMAAASPPGSRRLLLRVPRRLAARRALTRLARSARVSNPRVGTTYLSTSAIVTYLPVTPPTQISRASRCDI